MIDMGAEPFLVTSTVKVIVAQRLVRRLCQQKDEYKLSEAEVKELGKSADLNRVLSVLAEEKIIKKGTDWKNIILNDTNLSTLLFSLYA